MDGDAASGLKARLRRDLTDAMREKRAADTRVLRTLLAAIDNAQAVSVGPEKRNFVPRQFGDPSGEVARKALSCDDLVSILSSERDERLSSADACEAGGQAERALELQREAELVNRYLAELRP